MELRWGIAGASQAAHNFCRALNQTITSSTTVISGYHKIIAIASRTYERAQQFAQIHRIEKAYESYQKLATDPDIEIVYVAVINPQHYDVIKLLLQSGKHVLCAKPFAMSHAKAENIFTMASNCCVFIMEDMWTRFFPVYRHMGVLLDRLLLSGIGEVREVYVKHGVALSGDKTIMNKNSGGGITLNIGCYAIQFVLFAFREEPKSIRVEGKVNSAGLDVHFVVEMLFSGGRRGFITCSGLKQLENQATIITTKGPICVPNYWCPTMYIAMGQIHELSLSGNTNNSTKNNDNDNSNHDSMHSIGLCYEIDEILKCLRSGQLTCDIMPPLETLRIAKIQDEIRKQLNVQYN